MKPSEDIRPVTYMKMHSGDLIKEVNKRKSPIIITQNGEAKAVLLDIKSYERQQDVLLMLKIMLQGEKDIRDNKVVSQEIVFKTIENDILK